MSERSAMTLKDPVVPYGNTTAVQPQRTPSGPYRFTLAQYHAMIAQGILHEDDRAELINGQIHYKISINPPHAAAVYLCSEFLRARAHELEVIVFTERPISLSDDNEPEPDVALVHKRDDVYAASHPIGADILLIIEVADLSLERDRLIKRPRYAAAGIPEFWILNLRDRQLEVYTDPQPGQPELDIEAAFAKTILVPEGDEYAHPTLGEVHVGVLLPKLESNRE